MKLNTICLKSGTQFNVGDNLNAGGGEVNAVIITEILWCRDGYEKAKYECYVVKADDGSVFIVPTGSVDYLVGVSEKKKKSTNGPDEAQVDLPD